MKLTELLEDEYKDRVAAMQKARKQARAARISKQRLTSRLNAACHFADTLWTNPEAGPYITQLLQKAREIRNELFKGRHRRPKFSLYIRDSNLAINLPELIRQAAKQDGKGQNQYLLDLAKVDLREKKLLPEHESESE